jgi:hypothetical protein
VPTQYTVEQGDCISSIAAAYGTLWTTLWNHPDNSDLKQKRQDPNVLYPGDVVSLPDRQPKEQSCATDNLHKFKKTQQPAHIKIRLLLDDQPRANVSYQLQIAGKTMKGSTDGSGYLEQDIPPDAQTGVLTVTEGTVCDIYQLGFGTLDPIDTDDGVRERLESLGYDADTDLAAAVSGFQFKHGMQTTGVIDDTLRTSLQSEFGQ